MVPDVGTYYLDIAFRRERVASEIDGRLHETDVDLFESDRIRQNALMLRGWLVLRFTWHMLDQRSRVRDRHDPGGAWPSAGQTRGSMGSTDRDTPWLAG